MSNLTEFISYLNSKYKYGTFELSTVWAIEGLINNFSDELIHNIIIKVESRQFDDGFYEIIKLDEKIYTKEFKSMLILFLYKSRYFIDVFSDRNDFIFIEVQSSKAYIECLKKYKSDIAKYASSQNDGSDTLSYNILIDEHVKWVSGNDIDELKIDKLKGKGLIRDESISELKRDKEKKNQDLPMVFPKDLNK